MKYITLTRSVSRLLLFFYCIFSFTSSSNLFGACVCDPTTGCARPYATAPSCASCTAPACTECGCCNIVPQSQGPSGDTYMRRYFVTGAHGRMTFIGNTLGLSKVTCSPTGIDGNNPGPPDTDAIGAFTTINPADIANTYVSCTSPPPTASSNNLGGTTLDWTKNSSSAIITYLPIKTALNPVPILHAELIWSGSYGYYCEPSNEADSIGVDPNCILNPASNVPVKFTTPDGVTHNILADPATAMQSQNPGTPINAGNYVRSQDVTSILNSLGANINGTYTVGGVPATIAGTNNTQNAAGWTLAIIYQDPVNILDINNMTLFISNQQASNTAGEAEISGFCAGNAPGTLFNARLLVSAIETDANKAGDQFLFGVTAATNVLSGFNNPPMNFFSAQINICNDLDPLVGHLDTTGTFGTLNTIVGPPNGSNASSSNAGGVLCNQGRQGYDITNVNVTPYLSPGDTTAFARATTDGDDYMVNALGLQISVVSPVIVPIKRVNGVDSIESNVGEVVTFSIDFTNTGLVDAVNVVFQDLLETGLALVPNTFSVNGGPTSTPDLAAGVLIGTVGVGESISIVFKVQIIAPPVSGNIFHNRGQVTFDYLACQDAITSLGLTNIVTITLPNNPPPPPGPPNVQSVVKKCKFLNRDLYSLTITWDPIPPPTAVVEYHILQNGQVVGIVPATGPFIFEACLNSKNEASQFSVVAVYPGNVGSAPIKIEG